MGGLADSVGSVAVVISGDYSQLQSDLDDAAHYAEQQGGAIAEAFNAAGDAADTAGPQLDGLGESLHNAGDRAHESEGAFSELSEKLVDLATEMGLVIGAGEAIRETFESFSRVESASVALTALTGSAETAQEQIEFLEQLATNENLSFPALLDANQRMVAFGFSAEDIPAALQAAADSAAALNVNIDVTANALERMAASGMAGSRQLVQLGVTTADLAEIMGVTEANVKLAFAALDQETRLEVLTAALDKFAGTAQKSAETLRGEWQGVKNTFEGFFVTLGGFLEPAAKAILHWFDTIGKSAQLFVLAIQVNLEKLEFYFETFTGQLAAAQAKAQEVNANAAKFRELLAGGTGVGGGVGAGKAPAGPDLDALKAKVQQQLAAAGGPFVETDKLKPIEDATSDLAILSDQLTQFESRQRATTAAIAAFKTQMEDAGHSMTAAGAAANYFFDQQLKAADGIEALKNSTPPAIDDMGNLSETGERTSKTWQELVKTTDDWNKTLDGMEGKITPPLDALHEGLYRIDQDLATGNFARVQNVINRIAEDDLPSAVEQQERFVKALENSATGANKLADAQRQLLDLQIQLAIQQDRSTASYATKLALLDLETKNLGYDTKQVLGTTATQALNVLDHSIGQIGSAIAKTAIETKNWGQMFHQLITQLAESLIGTLLNSLIKWGEQFALEKLTEATTSQATAIAAVTNAAGVGFANAFASISAIPIVGPAMAPGVAAATEAAIIAGGMPLASAAEGALLGADTIVQAHADEMILPPTLSNGLQDLITSGKSAGPTNVLQIGQVSGVMRDTVKALATEIFRQAKTSGVFH